MKKHLTATALFCCFSLFLWSQKTTPAQGEQSYPNFTEPLRDTWLGKFERHQKRIAKLLTLSEAQLNRLDSLNDVYVTQRAALLEDKSNSRRDKKMELIGLQGERETRFKNILTESQLKKWSELKKSKKKKAFKKK
jgi:hypothetical protein